MDPNLVLEIIKLGEEIALQILKDMPPPQKQKFWDDYAARRTFWENVFKKLSGTT